MKLMKGKTTLLAEWVSWELTAWVLVTQFPCHCLINKSAFCCCCLCCYCWFVCCCFLFCFSVWYANKYRQKYCSSFHPKWTRFPFPRPICMSGSNFLTVLQHTVNILAAGTSILLCALHYLTEWQFCQCGHPARIVNWTRCWDKR